MEANAEIIASTVEPFIFITRLQPYEIKFTADLKNEVGGLSYSETYVEIQMRQNLRLLYERIYNTTLPSDTQILFGIGSTQLINGFFYAVARKRGKRTKVGFQNKNPPTFDFIKNIVNITRDCQFVDENPNIEVVVCPNNPNGALIEEDPKLLDKYVLIDTVYDVPIYTGVFEPVDPLIFNTFNKNKKSVIVSSFSSFGLPGARCGYMLIRDPEIFEYMKQFLFASSIANSANLALINTAMERFFLNRSFYLGPMNRLKNRINEIKELLTEKGVEILNKTFYAPYIYTGKSADWWKTNYNVITESGTTFNDVADHSRLSLMIAEPAWKSLIERLQTV